MTTPEDSPQVPDPEAHELALMESQFRVRLDALLEHFNADGLEWTLAHENHDYEITIMADADGTNRQFRMVISDKEREHKGELHITEAAGALEITLAYGGVPLGTDIAELIEKDDPSVVLGGKANEVDLKTAVLALGDIRNWPGVMIIQPAARPKTPYTDTERVCYYPSRYNRQGRHTRNRSYPA